MPPGISTVNRVPLAQTGATDCHFHVFPAGLEPAAGARYAPAYEALIGDWQQKAEHKGVTRGVLVQPSFLGYDNSYLLEVLRNSPALLRGVAVVAPDTDIAQLQEMHQLGIRGIRLNLVGSDHRISPESEGLFASILTLGWHVELHTEPGKLLGVLQQLPTDLTLVLDHFGKPAEPAEIDEVASGRQGRLFVKLSAPYRLVNLQPRELARRWLAHLGPHRLLWGSDWPCTAHEAQQPIAQDPAILSHWLGDEDVVCHVLCHNPERLYWS